MTLLYQLGVCVTDLLAFLCPVMRIRALEMCVHGQRGNWKGNCHNDWVIRLGPDFCDYSHCCFYNCRSIRKTVVKHPSQKLKGDSYYLSKKNRGVSFGYVMDATVED